MAFLSTSSDFWTWKYQAVFESITLEMTACGYDHDWNQCWFKDKVLMQWHVEVQHANYMSGTCKVTCTFCVEQFYILIADDAVLLPCIMTATCIAQDSDADSNARNDTAIIANHSDDLGDVQGHRLPCLESCTDLEMDFDSDS